MSTFSERLKKMRVNHGITGQQIAKAVNVSYTAYMNYENRGSQPPFDVLCKIADVLGVSTDYLLGHNLSPYQPILDSGYRIKGEYVKEGTRYFVIENPLIDIEAEPPEEYAVSQGELMAVCEAFRAVQRNVCSMEAMRKILLAFGFDWLDVLDENGNPANEDFKSFDE